MPRTLNEIKAHIRAVIANPAISTTLIQTEDLAVLCDAAVELNREQLHCEVTMPRIPDEPLRKVTLNLYEADVRWCQNHYGQGYTEIIRQALREYVKQRRSGIDE